MVARLRAILDRDKAEADIEGTGRRTITLEEPNPGITRGMRPVNDFAAFSVGDEVVFIGGRRGTIITASDVQSLFYPVRAPIRAVRGDGAVVTPAGTFNVAQGAFLRGGPLAAGGYLDASVWFDAQEHAMVIAGGEIR